ncbi:MAG: flagellar export chaperone FlgN [Thermogutta sp.]
MPDFITELWSEKHAILTDIYELTQHQYTYVENNQIDGVLDILAQKQRLLARLQQVDSRLKHSGDQKGGSAEDTRNIASGLPEVVRACRELLEKIVQVEQECHARLEKRRDAIAAELGQLHEVSRARAAYMGGNAISGGELDLTL